VPLLQSTNEKFTKRPHTMNQQSQMRRHPLLVRFSSEQDGFTIVQMIITVALIGILTAFAFIGVTRARTSMALQNSVRLLANNVEKARLDAVRRHSDPINSPTTASKVWFTSNNTYSVTMDFAGTGTPTTRSFTFDQNVPGIPAGSPLPSVSFNWRGRTSSCTNTFAVFNANGEQSTVDVSDAGEVTIDSDVDVLPTVTYDPANPTVDVSSGTVVTGTGTHNNTVDCNGAAGGTGGTESGGGTGGCPSWTVTPTSLVIQKNGGSSGTIQLTIGGGGLNAVTASAPINLQVTPAATTVAGGSTATFSVTSLNKTRGTFAVTLTLPCSTPQVMVKVTN
jgi:Tfp pilus assembly protein FimT